MKLLTLAVLAALASPAWAEPVYRPAGGPGCDTPEAVRTLYLELDKLPGTTPIAIVIAIIADRHAHGLTCSVSPREPLADAGSVGEFVRPSDGATMQIIKYLRQGGPPTYSWRQAPGTAT